MTSVLYPQAAKDVAKLIAVVVLATPPFWLAMAKILALSGTWVLVTANFVSGWASHPAGGRTGVGLVANVAKVPGEPHPQKTHHGAGANHLERRL